MARNGRAILVKLRTQDFLQILWNHDGTPDQRVIIFCRHHTFPSYGRWNVALKFSKLDWSCGSCIEKEERVRRRRGLVLSDEQLKQKISPYVMERCERGYKTAVRGEGTSVESAANVPE